MGKLSHFDEDGKAAMVDVSAKQITERSATAEGRIVMAPETLGDADLFAGQGGEGGGDAGQRLANREQLGHEFSRRNSPDLPPVLWVRRTAPMVMARSAALHMS